MYCTSATAYLICNYLSFFSNREYWKDEGIVTGGQYDSNEGCQPYKIPKCNHHEPGPYDNCSAIMHTPKCEKKCVDGYSVEFDKDKHLGKSAYSVRRDVKEIQTEIMTNGPVEGAFTVFADFPTYKSGNYKCIFYIDSLNIKRTFPAAPHPLPIKL